MKTESKREAEKALVAQMIRLYCKKNHKCKQLCGECESLLQYAHFKSDKCPFIDSKTFCSSCKVHCYNAEMRGKIRMVMRFSAPRLLFCRPAAVLKHLIESIKEKQN